MDSERGRETVMAFLLRGPHAQELVDFVSVREAGDKDMLGAVHRPAPHGGARGRVCVCVCVCVFVCDSEVLDVVRGPGSRPRRPSGGLYSNMEFS